MNSIRLWLICSAIMCIIMIFIGGITRLSEAGLSIVEWKPVTGVLPPLSNTGWTEEFGKYQASPEYRIINHKITLDGFKKIFLIEFIHRIAARLTGLVICIPLLWLYISGRLPFRQNKSYLLMPILLFAQGFMGWYMVKSGLKLDPHVSHFRLSAHLMLAIALYSFIVWKLLPYSREGNDEKCIIGHITIVSIYVQIALGGFVAGLDAGMIYNTFPLMGDRFIPTEFTTSTFIALWSDPTSVQFMHRCIAYFVTICAIIFALKLKNKTSLFILSAIFIQVATGIATLIYVVPMTLALLHQIGAVMLLTAVLIGNSQQQNPNSLSDLRIS